MLLQIIKNIFVGPFDNWVNFQYAALNTDNRRISDITEVKDEFACGQTGAGVCVSDAIPGDMQTTFPAHAVKAGVFFAHTQRHWRAGMRVTD